MGRLRTVISLRLFGSSFDPAEIARELNLSTDIAWKAGEPRMTRHGTRLDGTYPSSYCSFAMHKEEGEGLRDALERCVVFLRPCKALLGRIRADGGRAEIFIGWFSVGNTGEVFEAALLAALGDLGVDIALDVYGEDEPMEAGPAA